MIQSFCASLLTPMKMVESSNVGGSLVISQKYDSATTYRFNFIRSTAEKYDKFRLLNKFTQLYGLHDSQPTDISYENIFHSQEKFLTLMVITSARTFDNAAFLFGAVNVGLVRLIAVQQKSDAESGTNYRKSTKQKRTQSQHHTYSRFFANNCF